MLTLHAIDYRLTPAAPPLLEEVNLQVPAGSIACILGPSGAGKSTLLRLIAGLVSPISGRLNWHDDDLLQVPAYRRRFSLLFQDYALFPHLDVVNNVMFGPVELGMNRSAARRIAEQELSRWRVNHLAGRRVQTLSGGEQQRVALARAMATTPRVLLLDEPLSALDEATRAALKPELVNAINAHGMAAVWVTHDRQEAESVADAMYQLINGRLLPLA